MRAHLLTYLSSCPCAHSSGQGEGHLEIGQSFNWGATLPPGLEAFQAPLTEIQEMESDPVPLAPAIDFCGQKGVCSCSPSVHRGEGTTPALHMVTEGLESFKTSPPL